MFYKFDVLKNFSKFKGKHLCWSLFLNKVTKACNFIKKETLVQVFSCEFCEISKNIFFHRTPPVAASSLSKYGSQKNSPKKCSGGRKAQNNRGEMWLEAVISIYDQRGISQTN